MSSKAFVVLIVLGMVLLVAAQCGPAPTPQVVEKVVKETVQVPVQVTQIVEKKVEVVVTATPEPKPALATTIRVDALTEDAARVFEDLVVKPFAKEQGVDIKVEQGTYAQQEEWLARVKAAPGEYCLALYVSDFGLYAGVAQGLLQPLRLENIPNFSNLEDKWEKRVIVEGDSKPYVGTVSMGMYTFVYAKDKISQLPETYAPMFDPQYADHIALRDYGLYRVLETAAYLGMDPNNLSDQDVDKIFETMTEQRKLVRAYWQTSSQLDELLANREVWLADYWFDTLTRPDEEGKNRLEKLDVGWWFPKEGGPMWSGGVVIASGCEDPQRYTAELLIDYLFKPEVYTAYAKAQGYTPVLEPDLYDSKAFFSDIPDRAAYRDAMINTGTLLNLSQIMANQENWNERYEEMKLGQ